MIRSNLYTFIHCACFLLVSVGVTAGNLTKPESASDTLCCEPLLLHFRFDRSLVEYDYMDNPHTLAAFSTLFADSLSTAQIDTVTITSYASPEGDTHYNFRLAHRRAVAVKGYLLWKYPHLDQYRILILPQGEDWTGLRRLIEADTSVPDREDALGILDKVSDTSHYKVLLRRLNEGRAYRYINKYLLPQLRNAAVCTVRMKQQPEEQVSGLDTEEKCTGDLKMADCIRMADTLKVDDTTLFNRIGKVGISSSYASRPLLSVKTNLLSLTGITPEGGLASFRPNLALEFFFARHWSVTASAEYSYWKGGKNKEFWGISGYSLEPRFWLAGNNRYRWFYVGIYAQTGDFDHQPYPAVVTNGAQAGTNATGTYLSTGLSLGVYVPLTRHLGLEAGLRAGYRQASGSAYDYEIPYYYYHHDLSSTRWGITGLNLNLSYRWWTQSKKR